MLYLRFSLQYKWKIAVFWDVMRCSIVLSQYSMGPSTAESNLCLVNPSRNVIHLNFLLTFPPLNFFLTSFPFKNIFLASFSSGSLLLFSYWHTSHFQCHCCPLRSPSLCSTFHGCFPTWPTFLPRRWRH